MCLAFLTLILVVSIASSPFTDELLTFVTALCFGCGMSGSLRAGGGRIGALSPAFAMTAASVSIHWSKQFFAALATVLRLAGSLISFLVQVRFLGPHQFGVIGFAYTIAGPASVLADFGMNVYAMRWASAEPERRAVLISLCVIVKTFLSAVLLLPCLVWVHLLGFSAWDKARRRSP